MELINGRYRITKNSYQNQLISSYAAADLYKGNRKVEFNIFNPDNIKDEIMSFFSSEFLGLTSINSCRIAKLHGFGVINSLDGKKLQVKKYFYTRESLEDYVSILAFTEEIEKNKIMDIFWKVCQAINYLHKHSFVYGELNLSNIYIKKSDGEYDIKLKDIATVELEKHMYWFQKKTQFQFKSPEVLSGNKPTVATDIYSLGVLFVMLNCLGKVDDTNFRQVINDIKNSSNYELFSSTSYNKNDLVDFIEKMSNQYPDKRHKGVNEVIEDINNIFETNYKPFIKRELEEIVGKTKIIGRDREIKKVLDTNEMLEKGKTLGNIILVHGEHGIGKTRFLRELYYRFSLKKMDMYQNINCNGLVKSGRLVIELARQMLSKCDAETREYYSKELARLVPGIEPESGNDSIFQYSSDKEKYYIFNRVLSLINECIKNKPSVFILDNFHLLNDENIEMLEYLLKNAQNQRIIVILSYCDSNDEDSAKAAMFSQNIKTVKKVQDIVLGSLNIEETAVMIKNMLGLPNIPMKLATRIYTETNGNPLFIEEIIKNLCAEGLLYVDDNSGSWSIEIDDYDKIPLPSNIYRAVLNQIRSLDSTCTEILNVMSIFNTSISETAISEILTIDRQLVESKLEFMVKKGILDKKVEDWGYTYDLHNIGVKTFIYNELDAQERKEKHKIAEEFLERQYASEGRENKEELIYHLEKAGEKEKAIEYCVEAALSMWNLQFRSEAIKKFEKALSMFSEDSRNEKKIDVLIRTGDIYNETGDNITAIKYYEDAYKLAKSLDFCKSCIDILVKTAEIHVQKNDLSKGSHFIELSKEYYERADYEEGYLKAQLIIARISFNKQEFDEVTRICNEGITRCRGKYTELEAKFYNQIGITYLQLSQPDDAYAVFNKSIKLFEKINNQRGIALSLNNLGVIYGDFYQNIEDSIKIYTRMKEICERHNILDLQITAVSNLAECGYDMEEYEQSLSYYKSALELSQKIGFEAQVFNAYVNLCKVSLRLFQYRNAYDYFVSASKELESYPIQRKDFMGEFYIAAGNLFYKFGDMEKAEDYALKAYKIYKNDDYVSGWNVQILLQYINIEKSSDLKSIQDGILKIRDINRNYASIGEKVRNLHHIANISVKNGDLNLAQELVDEINRLSENSEISSIKAKYLCVKGIFEKGVSKVKYLEESLELSKKERLREYELFSLLSMGDYYFEQKEYYSAIKYYFEACEIIKKLTMEIQGEYRLRYLINSNYLHPFRKLIEINMIYNGRTFSSLLDNIMSNNLTIGNLKDLFEYRDLFGILNSKQFIKAAERDYDYLLPRDIKNINDGIYNLSGDSIKDLDLIVKLAAKMTLATSSYILMVGENQDISVVASKDNDIDVPSIKYIIERVKATKEPVFIAEKIYEEKEEDIDILPQGIKAAICIPIMEKIISDNMPESEDRRRAIARRNQIVGYLYIDSDRILNNFNKGTFYQCCQLRGLIKIAIDNYRLRTIASIDKLTGVFTRKYLEDAIEEELERVSSNNGKFTLIMFDVDKFKNVNDKFGHQKGDMVLSEICKVVRKNIRKGDVCGRYGGEEFIIILPDAAAEDGELIAEKLRDRVEKARILGDKYPVTMSLGVASYPEHGSSEHELIERVDQALYVAKEAGRNKLQVWNNQISNKVKRKDKLAGIVSGNMVQDNRNVLALLELIELIREDASREDKIYKLLGRIIEISEAQNGMLFTIKNGNIVDKYGRRKFDEKWVEVKRYNLEIIKEVLRDKQGIYRVDWDDISDHDALTGAPDWQSVIVTPLIKSEEVRGILYLTVSSRTKEFDFNHFNFVNTLGDITAAIL